MPVIGGSTDSFKAELFRAIHDFGADTFKMALYDNSADIGPSTTAYTTSNEVTGTGYSAGGATLTMGPISSSLGVSWTDITDVSWPGASFTARAGLIYNATNSNRAVLILDFGAPRVFTSASNTVTFPAPGMNTAIIRIGYPR